MMDETIFQGLFIFITAAFVFLWGFNILSIGLTQDKFYSNTEGIWIALPRFILLGASLTGMLVFCIHPPHMDWSVFPMPFWIRWSGFVLGFAALTLFFWVIRSLGRNFSTSLVIQKEQTLVVRGPYRWVRHPMYTSFILLWLGYFFLSMNWFIGLTGMIGFVLTIVVRTPKEEQMMINRFGEEYLSYMKRTGRYLPTPFFG